MTTDPRIIEAEAVVAKADPNAFKHSEVRKIKRGFKAAIDLVAEQQHHIISLSEDFTCANAHINRQREEIAELTATNDSLRDDVTALIIEKNQLAKQVLDKQDELDRLRDQVAFVPGLRSVLAETSHETHLALQQESQA